MAKHQNLSSPYAIHPFAFTSNADPASDGSIDMAPYKGWINTGNSNLLKVRNAANGAWEDVSVAGAATSTAFGSNSTSVTTYNDNAGTLAAANAHHHIGVTSLAHASNTYSGPITLTTPGNTVGITSPGAGQLAFTATATSSGSTAIQGTVVRVTNSANVALVQNDYKYITFNTDRFDPHGFHDTGSNTSRLTVPADFAGNYIIGFSGECSAGLGAGQWAVFRLNGTTIIGLMAVPSDASATFINGTTAYPLSVGDYVEIGIHTSSASENLIYNDIMEPIFWLARLP